ncbi:hypothetical protein L210DRAFT_3499311 [Boletus edulis BED1]|uniref:Uncharacterized protein n=1 Tax=Boletus edulis BED1 TaxID=1328754 RepID=A0AAD4C8N2_BOLED|nr:hypothetical protein L210DRAFT_3499311 [Boletus edulis BED1]
MANDSLRTRLSPREMDRAHPYYPPPLQKVLLQRRPSVELFAADKNVVAVWKATYSALMERTTMALFADSNKTSFKLVRLYAARAAWALSNAIFLLRLGCAIDYHLCELSGVGQCLLGLRDELGPACSAKSRRFLRRIQHGLLRHVVGQS